MHLNWGHLIGTWEDCTFPSAYVLIQWEQNLWEHFKVISVKQGLSSQQIEQFSSDTSPLTGKETTPIATWASFNGRSTSALGTHFREKVSRFLACSRILCLSAPRSGISSSLSFVTCQKHTSLDYTWHEVHKKRWYPESNHWKGLILLKLQGK